jgi:ribosomal protein L11 methylase PrmA
MSIYIDPPPDLEFDVPFPDVPSPRTVIELGSGTGIAAAAIAKVLDAQKDLVIATDLPEVSRYVTSTSC